MCLAELARKTERVSEDNVRAREKKDEITDVATDSDKQQQYRKSKLNLVLTQKGS